MAIEVLAQLVVSGPADEVEAFLGGRSVREWKLDAFFAGLTPAQQRAFLEIAAAATLVDGKLSDRESAWLDRRRAEAKGRDVVDAAIATATEVLPPHDRPDELRAFVAQRAALLATDGDRERAFFAAAALLARSGAADVPETTRLFGEAMGLSGETIASTQRLIDASATR